MNRNFVINGRKKNLIRILALGTLSCIFLLVLRVYHTSNLSFSFLAWNLFLAWVPLVLSETMLQLSERKAPSWLTASVFMSWLLFFPNAPYILTDLFHLDQKQGIPLWFDLVLIITFAWNGLMLGFVSLFEIQFFLKRKFSDMLSWFAVTGILVLSSFGVYLGRFERWNSWDIITNPVSLAADIAVRCIHPFAYPRTLGVTLFFSMFLLISYLTLFHLIRSKRYE